MTKSTIDPVPPPDKIPEGMTVEDGRLRKLYHDEYTKIEHFNFKTMSPQNAIECLERIGDPKHDNLIRWIKESIEFRRVADESRTSLAEAERRVKGVDWMGNPIDDPYYKSREPEG